MSESNQQNTKHALDAAVDSNIKVKNWLKVAIGTIVVGFLAIYAISIVLVKGHSLVVAPDEAVESTQIRVISGLGHVSGNTVYRIGELAIEVTADRYQTAQLSLTDASPNPVNITLEPSPARLLGNVDVEGQSTQWLVDDMVLHLGQTFEHSLKPGEYKIAVNNPYFAPWTETMILERGQDYDINLELEEITGYVTLQSTPSGAQVFMGDELVGETPMAVEVTGGLYEVRIALDGYQTVNDPIEVTYQNPQPKRDYKLIPQQAILTVSVQPEGGVLLVDGVQVAPGQISVDADRQHVVRYSVPGYYEYAAEFLMSPGESGELDIALEEEVGVVQISSNVEANIAIDGQPAGTTPAVFEIQALATEVTLSRPGYRSQKRVIEPSGEQRLTLEFELLTEFDARRKEGKPLFAETLGMQFKRFRPGTFKMGSPANQPGRRPNEHQVNVSFDKSIWVTLHEVTEAQFRAFDSGRANSSMPVTNVSWLDAVMYCNWLSEKEGLPAYYRIQNGRFAGINPQSRGYRLPTEAEWEWLATRAGRAASTTYFWGNSQRIPNKSGNFGDESIKGTQAFVLTGYRDNFASKAPVGSLKAENNGLFDLSGNVSEWVFDRYSSVAPDTSKTHMNYLGASRGADRIYKGGNYKTGRLKDLRPALRNFGTTGEDTLGFRIVRFD